MLRILWLLLILSRAASADVKPTTHAIGSAVAGAAVISLWQLGKEFPPAGCALCGTNALDDRIRAGLRWHNTERAAAVSDGMIVGVGVAAVLVTGLPASTNRRWHDAGLAVWPVVDSLIVSQLVTTSLKMSLRRVRPRAWAAAPTQGDLGADPYWSLPSGHTSTAFALATAAGTVASMQGRSYAKWVWLVGLAAASTTAYLRIAADAHWLSDTLAGAAIGTASGMLVPRALHAKLGVVADAHSVSLVGTW